MIPIGVDTERFRPDWARRTGRRALGVGVVRPFKRWELAARALQGTGLSLTIAGPTPDPVYARAVADAGDEVRVAGEVSGPELERLYAECDVLVHPSRVELLAGVVLQGLAAGLPVLGCEPVADLIDEGRTGTAAPRGASDDEIVARFRSAAIALRDDAGRRRTMGDAARARALERFSWPAVVAQHLAVYREAGTASA